MNAKGKTPIGTKVLIGYIIMAVIFTILFNIQGIYRHGFGWGIADGMVAAAKGILWIIYIWI